MDTDELGPKRLFSIGGVVSRCDTDESQRGASRSEIGGLDRGVAAVEGPVEVGAS